MYKAFLFVCFYCLFSFFALARGLDFVANQGQWDNILRYKANISGGTFYLTDEGFRFYLYQMPNEAPLSQATNESFPQSAEGSPATDSLMIQGHYYKVNFLKAAAQTEYVEENASSSYHNYFLGNDHTKWRSKVPLYGSITRKNIYPGIDLKVHSNEDGNFKYDFVIAPHADHSQIKLEYEGIVPQLTAEGHLLLPTACGDMQELAPYSYQNIGGKKETVKSRYVLEENVLRFEVSAYNPEYPLVIDPEVIAATYWGKGVPADLQVHIRTTYDIHGNFYVGALDETGGEILLPVLPGTFQLPYAGGGDCIILKYNADLSQLLFATYYGGQANEYLSGMITNESGELVIMGTTHSYDLPVTSNAYQSSISGNTYDHSAFLAKFSAYDSELLSATYLHVKSGIGYNGNPISHGLDFDQQGNIWSSIMIYADTAYPDTFHFPTTSNAAYPDLPQQFSRGFVPIIFKMSSNLDSLLYGSYIYNPTLNYDSMYALQTGFIGDIKINQDNNVVFVNGGYILHNELYLSLLNNQSGSLMNQTPIITDVSPAIKPLRYLNDLAIGCNNEVYVTGGYHYEKLNGWSDNPQGPFAVSMFTPSLDSVLYSTRFGNEMGQYYYDDNNHSTRNISVSADGCGNIYMYITFKADINDIVDMPITLNAMRSSVLMQVLNSWIGVFSPDLKSLKYGSYIGDDKATTMVGSEGWGSIFSKEGILYSFVRGKHWDVVPSTAYKPDTSLTDPFGNDGLLYKLQLNAFPVRTLVVSGGGAGAAHPHAVKNCSEARIDFIKNSYDKDSITVHYEIVGDAVSGIDYQPLPDSLIFSANDSFQSLIIKPLSNATGGRKVIVNTIAPCQCDQVIISSDTIWIYDTLQVSILEPEAVCEGDTLTLQGVFDSVLTAVWQPESMILASSSDGSAISTVPYQTTTYTLTVSFPDVITCPPATAEVTVNTHPYPQTNLPDTLKVCEGDTLHIAMDVTPPGLDLTYYWSPNTHLRHDSSGNNYFYAPEGSYDYILTVINSAAGCQIDENLVVIVHPEFHLLSVDPEDTLVEYGTSLRLTAMGLAERWQWIPTHYLDNPAINNPTSVPISDIVYYVIGYDANNCTDTGEVRIRIDFNSNVFVPTAFSPNGDGVNDVFKPYHIRYEEIDAFLVYNRFGELVFSTTNPDEGWDGKHKGTEADIGVYYWYLRLKLPDGSVNEQMGDVSLLK